MAHRVDDPQATARTGSGPRGLRVVEVDPQTDLRWGAFVAGHPQGCVFHHPGWIEVLQREYRHRAVNLVCEDDEGEIHGLLPLSYTRGLPLGLGNHLIGRRLSSLPRTPLAGPLANGRRAYTALVAAAADRAAAEPNIRLQIKFRTAELDGLVPGLESRSWRTTYVLELPQNPEALRFGNPRNHARIKWGVNRAARAGVVVRPAETAADLRRWYSLYLKTMRSPAVPPRPYRLFEAMREVLEPQRLFRLLIAEQHDAGGRRMLAGSIFLMFGSTVFYGFSARDPRCPELRPNDVIQWHAIHDACRAGYSRYDLGEVTQHDQGLASFKAKWGGEATTLYRYYLPPPPADSGTVDETRGRLHRIGEAAWRRLPPRMTASLGDRLYEYL